MREMIPIIHVDRRPRPRWAALCLWVAGRHRRLVSPESNAGRSRGRSGAARPHSAALPRLRRRLSARPSGGRHRGDRRLAEQRHAVRGRVPRQATRSAAQFPARTRRQDRSVVRLRHHRGSRRPAGPRGRSQSHRHRARDEPHLRNPRRLALHRGLVDPAPARQERRLPRRGAGLLHSARARGARRGRGPGEHFRIRRACDL